MSKIKEYVEMEMNDGSVWQIPLSIMMVDMVTENIDDDDDEGFEKYADYMKENPDDVISWAEKNMELETFWKFAEMIKPPKVECYSKSWKSAPKKVVKKMKG